jgi:hypothetical protein
MTITNKTTFSSHGISFPTPSGNFTMIGGRGINLQPAADSVIISTTTQSNVIANGNGLPWIPPLFSNALAPNGSLFVSKTNGHISFKDASGNVHYLY